MVSLSEYPWSVIETLRLGPAYWTASPVEDSVRRKDVAPGGKVPPRRRTSGRRGLLVREGASSGRTRAPQDAGSAGRGLRRRRLRRTRLRRKRLRRTRAPQDEAPQEEAPQDESSAGRGSAGRGSAGRGSAGRGSA